MEKYDVYFEVVVSVKAESKDEAIKKAQETVAKLAKENPHHYFAVV